MFADNSAADGNTKLEEFSAEFFGAVKPDGDMAISKNQWMQVTVASIKYVSVAQTVLGFHLLDTQQHLRQILARNDAVHPVIIGRDSASRRKSSLATHNASSNHVGDRVAALHDIIKRHHNHTRRLRFRNQFNRHFDDYA